MTGKDTNPPPSFDILLELVNTRMPFGKYRDRRLCDLPEPYLVWLHRNGFPPGRLGTLLSALYEIKLNGLEYLLKQLAGSSKLISQKSKPSTLTTNDQDTSIKK